MNKTETKGSWLKTKSRLKQKFAALTDNDKVLLKKKKNEVIGRLQIKLGKSKEELQRIIEGL